MITVASTKDLLKRPSADNQKQRKQVEEIIRNVRENGDSALYSYSQSLDKVNLKTLKISADEFAAAEAAVPESLKKAILQAKENIEKFHRTQLISEAPVETTAGIICYRKSIAIENVGLYIPGGTAPLFSTVLMLAAPAAIAGSKRIFACTPPRADGTVHPALLYALKLCGVTEAYKSGGAHAIAAMAFGTETIAAADKIFGPGNSWVTTAKQLVQMEGVAIDMPAGPSEVLVIADHTANPAFIAADLLSQAEHGADSQVVLLSTDEQVLQQTLKEVERQTEQLPRKEFISASLEKSKAIYIESLDEALEWSNRYAPEHLILAVENAEKWAKKVVNAGSVFIGHFSPESVGDYASGTNHTLPTNGFARAYSGVSVDSFMKKVTFQKVSPQGLKNIAPTVVAMAEAEGLQAHANAVKIRLNENED